MKRSLLLLSLAVLAGLALASAAPSASAEPVRPPEISWHMVGTDMVRFNLHFSNPDAATPTAEVSGSMHSQEFGAFLPNFGLIGNFNVPPMQPNSFFDVFFDVPLSELPPSAGGGGPMLGSILLQPEPCPPQQWNGNVDVNWFGPGGVGQVNAHHGVVGLCPGGFKACVHAITMCPNPMTWSITGVCAGWNVTLENEDYSPAPAVLPANWTGWICVSADASVPVGSTCCFSVNFTCNGVTTPVDVCAYACDCPTPVREGSWGRIKTMYR